MRTSGRELTLNKALSDPLIRCLMAADKVDPVEFRKNAAMLSVVTYVLADMDGRLVGRKSAANE